MSTLKLNWLESCIIYLPPDQPVLTSQPVAPCFCIFSASIAAYLVGCSIMNAAPKQAENVAVGSLIPSSVPATRAVYPLIKWYMVCARDSLLTGGRTPKASQARSMTFFGCGPTHGNFVLKMYSMGYAARVFSATENETTQLSH